jgi:hypothetical protein
VYQQVSTSNPCPEHILLHLHCLVGRLRLLRWYVGALATACYSCVFVACSELESATKTENSFTGYVTLITGAC